MNVSEVLEKLNQLKATWAFTQESQFHSLEWSIRRGDWNSSIAKFALDRREVLLDVISPDFCPSELQAELEKIESILNRDYTGDTQDLMDVSGVERTTEFEDRFFEGGVTPLSKVLRDSSLARSEQDREFAHIETLHNIHLQRASVSSQLEDIVGMNADQFSEFELENSSKLELELMGE